MLLEFHQESGEVFSSEFPLEGMRQPGVTLLELKQTIPQLSQRDEVIRCEHLALNYREVDLHLVEPAGMSGSVNRNESWPSTTEPRAMLMRNESA